MSEKAETILNHVFYCVLGCALAICIVVIEGCGIHFTVVDGTIGTTGFAETVAKNSRSYKSGDASTASHEYDSVLEKKKITQIHAPINTRLPEAAQ